MGLTLAARITGTGPLGPGPRRPVGAELQRRADAAMTETVFFLVREVKRRTPQGVFGAQGGLLASIQGDLAGRGTPALKGIVASDKAYAETVEKGRRPGKALPPEGVLIRWIEEKLGLEREDALEAEYPIRRKIGRKGFEGVFMFQKALDENTGAVEGIWHRHGFAMARVVARG